MEQVPSFSGIWRPLMSLLLASLVAMGSPGPSTMSVTAAGAAFCFRRSLAYVAGIVLGTTAVLLTVSAGVVSMLTSLPRLAPLLVGASAAYIAYLAFKIATAPPLSRQDRAADAPSFAGGFLLAYWCRNLFVLLLPARGGRRMNLPGERRSPCQRVDWHAARPRWCMIRAEQSC